MKWNKMSISVRQRKALRDLMKCYAGSEWEKHLIDNYLMTDIENNQYYRKSWDYRGLKNNIMVMQMLAGKRRNSFAASDSTRINDLGDKHDSTE